MYLIHTDKRENNDIKIFYYPSEYGQNFSPISNLGKFIIYVNNENVGDVKFYEKDIIDDEIIEREDGRVGFGFTYQGNDIFLSYDEYMLKNTIYPKCDKLDELEVFKFFRDNKDLEYIEICDETRRKKMYQPTRATELFLKYCGVFVNYESKISKEEAIAQKEFRNKCELMILSYEDYFLALTDDKKVMAFEKTEEEAKQYSENIKHVKLGFLSEKSNDYFRLVRLAAKEDIENHNYEDLDDLNKILEQFKGFVVNEGEGRYCER